MVREQSDPAQPARCVPSRTAGPEPGGTRRPPKYKVAVVTWLAIYPLITITLAVVQPVLEGAALPLRTLVLTVVLVPLMVFVMVPVLQRVLRGWLSR